MIVALASFVMLAPAVAEGAPASKPLKVLVLDVDSTDLTSSEKTTLTNLAAAHLAENAALEILSGQDLKQLVALQGQAQEIGVAGTCSDACMAELAGALGAGVVVATQAGKLGDTLVITLAVFDASKAKSVSRKSVTATSLGAVPALLAPALDALMQPLLPPPPPPATAASSPPPPPTKPPPSSSPPAPQRDSPRLQELFAAESIQICTDAKDTTAWWFCTAKEGISENELVRRYRALTGAHDLDVHEANRAGAGGYIGAGAFSLLAVAGVGGASFGFGCGLFALCGDDLAAGLTAGSDGGALFPIMFVSALAITGGITGVALVWPDNAAVEGANTTHTLSEGDGRVAAARYNDALRSKLRREFAATPS